jgi:hypothetical protein
MVCRKTASRAHDADDDDDDDDEDEEDEDEDADAEASSRESSRKPVARTTTTNQSSTTKAGRPPRKTKEATATVYLNMLGQKQLTKKNNDDLSDSLSEKTQGKRLEQVVGMKTPKSSAGGRKIITPSLVKKTKDQRPIEAGGGTPGDESDMSSASKKAKHRDKDKDKQKNKNMLKEVQLVVIYI